MLPRSTTPLSPLLPSLPNAHEAWKAPHATLGAASWLLPGGHPWTDAKLRREGWCLVKLGGLGGAQGGRSSATAHPEAVSHCWLQAEAWEAQ